MLKVIYIYIYIAAACALFDLENMTAEEIAIKAMKIASDLCVYTNENFVLEKLDKVEEI